MKKHSPQTGSSTTNPTCHKAKPVLEHLDFLLCLARKLGTHSNFITPFPNITLALLEQEAKIYNETHFHQPVSIKTLPADYEVLKHVCRKDGGPLYQGNAPQVTIKDVIEQSLAYINAKALDSPKPLKQFVV